jgi:hypothetical protein
MRARVSKRGASGPGWLACGALVLFGCGGESEEGRSVAGEPAGGETSTSGSGAGSAASNPFGVCPTPLGTPEELALTPRADTNLELLALTLDTGHVTATQATYERVVADIETIRSLAPSLATVAFWPPHDGHSINLTFGSAAMDALGAGEYTAWDCLLAAYRVEIGGVIDVFPTYAPTLYLDGIFDMPRVAEVFSQLPDVSVAINTTAGRRTLCARRDGEHYEYVVDRTRGTCDSGPSCGGTARHFASDASGDIQVLETWMGGESSPAPSWFRDVCN